MRIERERFLSAERYKRTSDRRGNATGYKSKRIDTLAGTVDVAVSEQQIAFILTQAEDGTPVKEVCRQAGISVQTYYRWRTKYGGLMPSEMKRLKQLEEENVRLKRLVANLSLDKEMLQDVIRRKL